MIPGPVSVTASSKLPPDSETSTEGGPGIEIVDDREVKAGDAVTGKIDGMTMVLQVIAEVGGNVRVIFDDENAHENPLGEELLLSLNCE